MWSSAKGKAMRSQAIPSAIVTTTPDSGGALNG
jgi:hypothetical protein